MRPPRCTSGDLGSAPSLSYSFAREAVTRFGFCSKRLACSGMWNMADLREFRLSSLWLGNFPDMVLQRET